MSERRGKEGIEVCVCVCLCVSVFLCGMHRTRELHQWLVQ